MLKILKERSERKTWWADAPITAQPAPQGMLSTANRSENVTLIAKALHPSDTAP